MTQELLRAAFEREELQNDIVFADVAVDGARGTSSSGVLTYAVPARLANQLVVGQVVWVPIRRSLALGIIVTLGAPEPSFAVKDAHSVVEPPLRLDEERMEVASWLACETASGLYAAAAAFMPPGVAYQTIEYLRPRLPIESHLAASTPAQRRLLSLLAEQGEMSLDAARSALGARLTSVVPALEAAGAIERVIRGSSRQPKPRLDRFIRLAPNQVNGMALAPRQRAVLDFLHQRARLAHAGSDGFVRRDELIRGTGANAGTLAALLAKGALEEDCLPRGEIAPGAVRPAPELTVEQAAVWREVERALAAHDPTPILLHGVTGSGKTEIYLRAVAWCLRRGRSAIVLVPEISLATQVVGRFTARFPGKVAVLHSALPEAERFTTWNEVAAGRLPVVVGPRSALFAPVSDLGFICLDEEHEPAYKQESEPRYHARALAEFLAAQHGAPLLLGSATPAVETFWRAENGHARRLVLTQRVGPDLGRRDGDHPHEALALPEVELVDMRLELHRGNSTLFSDRLEEVLRATLAHGEQAMLFLNRRGLATIVLCRLCGAALQCPHCDIPLVYHQDRRRLLCHRCNFQEVPPPVCPHCAGTLDFFGAGTQRVEAEVKRLLPTARVLRWDQDSARRRGGSERMLRLVEQREIDVLVGTQMIAKGLDLPMVTAVGVIHADTMLHLPDFRSAERTFQLLTQVAGRAGRRAPGARVVVQSYTPDHYAIQAASRHDYAAFYTEEIDFRRRMGYPPYSRLIRYLFRHEDENACATEADQMARLLARHAWSRGVVVDLMGPTPAFASRIRGKYQWQIVLRAADPQPLLDGLPVRPGWTVDVDPQSLL